VSELKTAEPEAWVDGMAAVDVDLQHGGRRVVRGRRSDGTAVARIGGMHSGFEHEIVAWEDGQRVPVLDVVSQLAGALMPAVCAVTPGMAAESNTELVRVYVERFKNLQHFSVFPRVFASSFRHEFGYDGDPGGWASWAATGRTFLAGFPDVKVVLHDLFETDGFVVEHNLATGTHLGQFRHLKPTGRVVTWREIHVYRCEGGRVVRGRRWM
jgi:predicted ester cyclase